MNEIEIDHMQMRQMFSKRVAGDILNNSVLAENWRQVISDIHLILLEREEYVKQWTLPTDETLQTKVC